MINKFSLTLNFFWVVYIHSVSQRAVWVSFGHLISSVIYMKKYCKWTMWTPCFEISSKSGDPSSKSWLTPFVFETKWVQTKWVLVLYLAYDITSLSNAESPSIDISWIESLFKIGLLIFFLGTNLSRTQFIATYSHVTKLNEEYKLLIFFFPVYRL